MTQTALITGARGFLGRHAARRLRADGWTVLGIGRGRWSDAEAWGVGRWQEGSISLDGLLAMNVVPDLIVHCAGTSTVGACLSVPLDAFESTMGSTLAVLEFTRLCCPSALLVFTSSAAVYGKAAKQPIGEDASQHPVSLYGTLKKQAEEQCAAFSCYFGLHTLALRVFSAYGVASQKQLLWDACLKVQAGDSIFSGTGDEVRDWVDVSDIASLLSVIADRRTRFSGFRALNVSTGIGTDIRTVLKMLFRELGSEMLPSFDGEKREGDPPAYIGNNSSARSLGWAPQVDLERGLKNYARWFLTVSKREAIFPA